MNIFLFQKYVKTGSAVPGKSTGRPVLQLPQVRDCIHQQMLDDDETTLNQLQTRINQQFDVRMSTGSIHNIRRDLGWTFRGAAYCQMVRDVNKVKRLAFAQAHPDFADTCEDCIFTDETSVQLEHHRRRCARLAGQQPRPKPKPKHPVKVHVWAGISSRGATEVCVFEGKMDRFLYIHILDSTLLPFLRRAYPNGHRLIQDNDPKHTSKAAKNWMEGNEVNWYPTPPESPDMNPIEMVWHELKEWLRCEFKPHTKEQLIAGIHRFWEERMTPEKCRKYISHIRKVMPEIIRLEGQATGM